MSSTPYEIERKFLLLGVPDLGQLEAAAVSSSEIEQTYLVDPDGGAERVRRRRGGGQHDDHGHEERGEHDPTRPHEAPPASEARIASRCPRSDGVVVPIARARSAYRRASTSRLTACSATA